MRRSFKSAIGVLVLGLMGLSLGACSSTEDVAPPPCPSIYIISDGAKLTRFKPGPGRDIIDVLHQEELSGFAHGCEYDTDSTGAGDLTVFVAPTITSERGPANTSNDADFEYFIAITDSNKKVMDKARFPVVIPFPKNMTRIVWQRENPHSLSIPLKAGQTGQDYAIYLGLQLNQAELDYSRKNR